MHAPLIARLVLPMQIIHLLFVILVMQHIGMMLLLALVIVFQFVIHLIITISPTIVAICALQIALLVQPMLLTHLFFVPLVMSQLGLMLLIRVVMQFQFVIHLLITISPTTVAICAQQIVPLVPPIQITHLLFVHLVPLIPFAMLFRFVIHLLITISPTKVAMPAPLIAPLVPAMVLIRLFFVLHAIQQLGLMFLLRVVILFRLVIHQPITILPTIVAMHAPLIAQFVLQMLLIPLFFVLLVMPQLGLIFLLRVVMVYRFAIHLLITISPTTVALPALQIAPSVLPMLLTPLFFVLLVI